MSSLAHRSDEFSLLVIANLVDPSEVRLERIITEYLTPIARYWASLVSFNREDREDAQQEILDYLAEGAKPYDQRRKSMKTGHPLTGYDDSKSSANTFFSRVAESRAYNIAKMRKRKAKRDKVIWNLINYDKMVTVEVSDPVIASDNRKLANMP